MGDRTDLIDWDAYEKWIREQYRSPATARKAIVDLRTLLRDPELAANPASRQRQRDYYWAWETYLWYCDEERVAKPPASWAPPKPPPLPPRQRRRALKVKSDREPAISREHYMELRRLVRADPHQTAPALDVMLHTGLRIADVLRIPAKALRDAEAREDGAIKLVLKGQKPKVFYTWAAPESWARLTHYVTRTRHAPNVAAACTTNGNENPDTDGAAYKACDRRFKKLAELAGVKGRAHLHRARRTLAVLAREVASEQDVQQMLGHEQTRTTRIYTEEAHSKVAAKTLQKLNEHMEE